MQYGIPQCRTHEGGSAGGGHDDGKNARKEASERSRTRQFAYGAAVGKVRSGCELKDAQQVERERAKEQNQNRDHPGLLQLKAPADGPAKTAKYHQGAGQCRHGKQHAARKGQSMQCQGSLAARAVNQLQNLETEYRKHARHKVQNQAAQKSKTQGR